MIDYESLIEFEDSLQTSNPKDTCITLKNLELKIDLVAPSLPIDEVSVDVQSIFDQYNYQQDEFTSCNSCGKQVTASSSACCTKFIKDSQHISNLEANYWKSFLSNPTRTVNTLPNYTQFLLLNQGIPFQLRSTIWKKYFLINYNNEIPETSQLVYMNFQHSYNTETSDQINKDLNRTFPTISFFRDQNNIKQLEVVLNVYANYDVELGYCQGLLFLVGTLFYHFKHQLLTFHSLITIMESETELHDIFTQNLMSVTLNKWYSEFTSILGQVDPELSDHLHSFCDLKVFLFQWWLSFMSSHTPEFSIINRIMDFCLIQGWKIGMLKISLGLLIINKPILMSLMDGDEEVVYQHLLYECKWGLVLKDINWFFGELLLNFDSQLFFKQSPSKPMKSHKRTQSSMIDKLKNLNLSNYSLPSNQSVFSKKPENDLESVYSETTIESDSSSGFLKVPNTNEIMKQNKMMKDLLMRCLTQVDDELKRDINEITKQ